jgi:hypothetical protein
MKTILSKIKNRRKHKVVFRLPSGKKFCTVKFTDQEMSKINLSIKYQNIDIHQFFNNVLKEAAGEQFYEL